MLSSHYVFTLVFSLCIFFFKQKTAYEMRISDWSSDVCSSDLCCKQPWSARILTAPEFSGDHGFPCSCRCIRRGCRQTENDHKPSERGRDRRSSKAWGDQIGRAHV